MATAMPISGSSWSALHTFTTLGGHANLLI
jgi:hypothetical protein